MSKRSAAPAQTVLLFSYGTLQKRSVQLAHFGRELAGRADELPGYTIRLVPVDDPTISALTGEVQHASAEPSSSPGAAVSGIAFEITAKELAAADQYEEAAHYQRISAVLRSGDRAWVYVSRAKPM